MTSNWACGVEVSVPLILKLLDFHHAPPRIVRELLVQYVAYSSSGKLRAQTIHHLGFAKCAEALGL